MPPRKKPRHAKKNTTFATTSGPSPPPAHRSPCEPVNLTTQAGIPTSSPRHPWPRLENKKIRVDRDWANSPKEETEKPECINRPISETWDDYDTLFYNAWLNVEMLPTWLIDYPTLSSLGINADVTRLLTAIGLGKMPTTKYVLYPDLARQLLSTCQVYYENEHKKTAQEGYLTFMCRGMRYRIDFLDLCELYGFNSAPTCTELPTEWADLQIFWSHFGTGHYTSRHSLLKDIRHPALRYVACVLGNTILCKSDATHMRKSDLILLSSGTRHFFPPNFWTVDDPCADLNLGAVFAHHLTTYKSKAFAKQPVESVGSLLTPIFAYFNIDIGTAKMISADARMDIAHLQRIHWIKKDMQWVFNDAAGTTMLFKLPQPGYTSLETHGYHNLRFWLPPATWSVI
ncbi:hypothetical protein V5N11_031367 [Cardamine amara subsp. amara]|uniref:Arabidopsis retrotransposon Orf1 C-terminal domain-containing protein n=1 Tax=Cardamine amara subsp. amara TaxID=228776 RepID=A0ABD1A7E8_CARAN